MKAITEPIYQLPLPASYYQIAEPYLNKYFNIERRNINKQIFAAVAESSEQIPSEDFYNQDHLEFLIKHDLKIEFEVYNPQIISEWLKIYNITEKVEFNTTIIIATHFYIQITKAPSLEDNDLERVYMEDRDIYKHYVRPDMLQLYSFINDWKKTPTEAPITIICGNKKLQLDNKSNWIFTAINNHLEQYLRGIKNVDQAQLELEEKYSKKTGRKSNKFQNILINGIDKLFQDLTNNTEISNEQCRFVRDYLKYVDMPISEEEFDHEDDIKNIRSRIRYLRKLDYQANWIDENNLPYAFEYW
ncbi:hypothetical protein G7050_08645 [Dysgonomonas sp. HDW5A]|uniref:hypothetical protein n=1 Tax=Dysgonomonas sp. HDW5A TaxID=2714926 RepID=UPI00140DBD0E|nr:hypothetical protein [Dysgonomonas sp. HDW5A]QIK59891.1 hypothetical protein G7050_08645 [Dysgonomonas sp. HDW5A]